MRPFLMTAMAAAASVAASTRVIAQTESVIWSAPESTLPDASLTLDKKTGTFYGAAAGGGNGYGTIFSLVEKGGVWTHHVIYTFGGGADGFYPFGGLVEDSAGALYGTTWGGGSSHNGTAFKLTFNGSSWVHTVLHDFGSDGSAPFADLTIDRTTGAIYGTTNFGGPADCGTVFELTPSGGETLLHAFTAGIDGCGPVSRVREDSKGRLFGVTENGGVSGSGMAFMLEESLGVWTESLIHTFSAETGGWAPTDIDLDRRTGVIYGTTYDGGNCFGTCDGTVFSLTKSHKGFWRENMLYDFQGPDGESPLGIHLDPATGVLTGTTFYGGAHGVGMVFQLTKNGSSWTETNLHSFGGAGDGLAPMSRPIEDQRTGYLYGTTSEGGTNDGGGVAYEITP